MTDPTPRPDGGDDYEPESAPPLPGWLKFLAIGIALAVLVVIAVMLVGGGHTIPAH